MWFGILSVGLLAGFFLYYHFFGYFGHYGFDDMHYARLAKQFADGNFRVSTDHYTLRWGIIWLSGIAYRLFGVNDQSSGLFPVLAYLTSLVLVGRLMKGRPFAEWLFALYFLGLSQWVIFYSDKIMPDILIMVLVLSAYTLMNAVYSGAFSNRQPIAGFLLSCLLWAGFICKETMVLAVPPLVFFFLRDLYQRRNSGFWRGATGGGVLWAAIYFGYFYWTTDDLLFRFHAIQANSYFNECSYELLPAIETVKRISYEFILLSIRSGLAVALVFILPGLGKTDTTNRQDDFFAYSFLLLLLSANFMSTSYRAYSPLCLDPRHYLFLVPIAALAAAPRVYQYFIGSPRSRYLAGTIMLSGLTAGLSWYLGYANKIVYAGLFLLVLVKQVTGTKWQVVPVLVLCALFFIPPIQAIRVAQRSNYPIQKELILSTFTAPSHQNTLVITNPAQQHFGAYYLAFDTTRVRFKNYAEITPGAVRAADEVYLLMNGYTRYLAEWEWERLPKYAQQADTGNTLLFNKKGVSLYRIDKSRLLENLTSPE